MEKDKEKGIEITKDIVSFVVNLSEEIIHADANKDGKVSANEALGIATGNGLKLFGYIKDLGPAIEEIRDLDPGEVKELVFTAVNELDNLSQERKVWIRQVAHNTINLVNLGIQAPKVW